MKHEPVIAAEIRAQRVPPTVLVGLLVLAGVYLWVELHAPLNHDVAWLLDAGGRWVGGQQLYVDIIELNPPLIFYEYAGLTLGTFSKPFLIAGVIVAITVSSWWAARLKGAGWGIATFVLCVASGILDFGQRDHLAAIVAIPYLFAGRAHRNERVLIGVWAFLGFGLKPYLMLIPLGATLGRMLRERSIRPAISPENLTIGFLSVAYVAAATVAHPEYFTAMVPLARLVYFAYGASFTGEPVTIPLLALAAVIAAIGATKREFWPQTGALIGAIASYLLQGRFWTYQLVPAVALIFLLLLLMSDSPRDRRRFAIVLIVIAVMGSVMFARFRRHYADLIPRDATAVLFLSPHLGSAYPAVVDRNVTHASHYPALWTLPGAFRLLHDPGATAEAQSRAADVIRETRRTLVDDILRYCPNPIFADVRKRKPYFNGPFDFIAFLSGDPRFSGYRVGEKIGTFQLYHRVEPCPPNARAQLL